VTGREAAPDRTAEGVVLMRANNRESSSSEGGSSDIVK
jgi:hypothetical protein